MTKIISTFHNLTLSDIQTVGEYNIKLVAANPFLDNRGPDCKLMVTRR
jgi:hypothetical protein